MQLHSFIDCFMSMKLSCVLKRFISDPEETIHALFNTVLLKTNLIKYFLFKSSNPILSLDREISLKKVVVRNSTLLNV